MGDLYHQCCYITLEKKELSLLQQSDLIAPPMKLICSTFFCQMRIVHKKYSKVCVGSHYKHSDWTCRYHI